MDSNPVAVSRGVLRKRILKICSKFTEKHSCRSVVSIKLQSNPHIIRINLLTNLGVLKSDQRWEKLPPNEVSSLGVIRERTNIV